jgi:uncharacterized protein YkwD
VASRISIALGAACLAALVLAPSAFPAGIGNHRAVARGPQPAAATAAVASPLIAPASACPNQTDRTAPAAAQEQAMRCMTDFARAESGLGELAEDQQLDLSAAEKSGDVLRCDSFSHFACGREFTYWLREVGYIGEGCWHAGENLAWGTGEYGTVRSIFQAWMASPTHRQNILGDYDQVGINVAGGDLEGHAGARVWAAHFGSHCEA